MAIEWRVENIRVTLFSSSPIAIAEEDWRAVTQQEEAEIRQAIQGGRIFSGRFEDGQLSLSGAANRADIIFAAAPSTDAEPNLATLGSWETSRDKFLKFSLPWIQSFKFSITRVAFGAVLLYPTEGKKASYEILKELLSSVTVDTDAMADLVFRVNWPIDSKVLPGLRVNRITSWSAIHFFQAGIAFAPSTLSTRSPGGHAVRLEIDHSTDVDRIEPLVVGKLKSILEELVSHASENALNGERK